MSYQSANGIKLTKCDSQNWKTSSIIDPATSVKLAGEEAKDRLYEPKHKKKLVRVLTVVAYVFFVSLAAIMLSLYYVFLWNGDQKIRNAQYVTNKPNRQYFGGKCDSILAEMQQQFTANEFQESPATSATTVSTTTTEDDYENFEEFKKSTTFMKKLVYRYDENY